jgi:hypothetical protein
VNLNTAYKIFCFPYKKHHPEQEVVMPLKECIHNLTHSLLQWVDPMRRRGYGAPPSATKNITTSSSTDGRAVRLDSKQQSFPSPPAANGTGGVPTGTPRSSAFYICSSTIYKQQHAFNSFQAIARYTGQEKGVLFYGGISPSKIGLIAPPP